MNYDVIDFMVKSELKNAIEFFLETRHTLTEEDRHTLRSLLEVLSYFSISAEHQEYLQSNQARIDEALRVKTSLPENTFTVECIEENEDGSADVRVELGPKVRDQMMSEGFNFLLIKGIIGGTTEDVLRWAQRGKQEENTDRIMDQLSFDEETK